MTEAMPFLQKHDITFLRPPPITAGIVIYMENLMLIENATSIHLFRFDRIA